MRPDKRCASHVSLSPRVTAPVAKTRCGEGGGKAWAGGLLCGWMSCRRLAAVARSLGCLGSVICGVCTTNAGHVSPLKFVALRRVASLFACHPFANSLLFLHRFWQQHFCIFFRFFFVFVLKLRWTLPFV